MSHIAVVINVNNLHQVNMLSSPRCSLQPIFSSTKKLIFSSALVHLFVSRITQKLLYRFLGAMHQYALRELATPTCLAGWLSVKNSRYCTKTTKLILKIFRPSCSPIIEAFGTPCADTKFQREPLHRGLYLHGGWGKLAIFHGNGRYLGNGAR